MENARKFTVLYCIGTLSGQGGTERILSTKASIFADKYDIDVHICTIGKDTSRYYDFSRKVNFHNLYSPKTHELGHKIPVWGNLYIKKQLYKEYEKLIRKFSPDIVIVLASGTDDFYIPNICHKLGIPVAREFHCSKGAVYSMAKLIKSRLGRLRYFLQKRRNFHAFNNYDYLLLLTVKDQIEGKYGTNSIVIPNFVPDVVSEDMVADVRKSKTFISVGSMRDGGKGFDTIIKAWATISKKYPDWKFEIYGDGPYKERLLCLVEELNVVDSVKLCGTTKDIASKYKASAFFVFASIGEGLPMVLIEAMRYGLPCVSYDCQAGPSDIITDGKDGILVPMDDFEGLIRGIEMEINDVEMRAGHAQQARLKSLKFSEESIMPQWIEFFQNFGYREI